MIRKYLLVATTLVACTLLQCKSSSPSANMKDAHNIQEKPLNDKSDLAKLLPPGKKALIGNCEVRPSSNMIIVSSNDAPDVEMSIPTSLELGKWVVWQQTPTTSVQKYENSASYLDIPGGRQFIYRFAENKPGTRRQLNLYTMKLSTSTGGTVTGISAEIYSAESNSNASIGKISLKHRIDCGTKH